MRRVLLLCLAAVTLSGCAALDALDRAAEPLDVHELRAPAEVPAAPGSGAAQVVVEAPSAAGAIATDRILVRDGATRVAYLPDARWSAEAPEMVRSAMVETLIRAGAFGFVGRRPLGASGDYALVSELVDFGARPETEGAGADGAGAEVAMTLVARLVRERDAEIVAARRFAHAVRVPDTSTPALLSGFAAVSDAVLTDLAGWAARAAGRG